MSATLPSGRPLEKLRRRRFTPSAATVRVPRHDDQRRTGIVIVRPVAGSESPRLLLSPVPQSPALFLQTAPPLPHFIAVQGNRRQAIHHREGQYQLRQKSATLLGDPISPNNRSSRQGLRDRTSRLRGSRASTCSADDSGIANPRSSQKKLPLTAATHFLLARATMVVTPARDSASSGTHLVTQNHAVESQQFFPLRDRPKALGCVRPSSCLQESSAQRRGSFPDPAPRSDLYPRLR